MMRSILPVSARMGIVFAAFALCASVRPTVAIQPTLEKITQEADGTVTYHFKIRIDETIHVEGQGKEPNPDFFTILISQAWFLVPRSNQRVGLFRPLPTG